MNLSPKISYISVNKINLKAKKTFFITDELIWGKNSQFFSNNFTQKLILKNPKADEKNLKLITKNLKDCDFILAFGSGTISDLCKYTSAQKNIPYAIIPSAASMNGYLSKNASITISGHKKTLPATLPQEVFCDLRILKSAPKKLTKAGIGDSLCFYSCWFDWYLSHQILGTKFDPKPFTMLRQKMDFFIKNFDQFSIRDESFLKNLIEILFLSGQGMTIAKGSYPASQSEHLIAHTIEMKYPELAEKNLHGATIAVTTLTTAFLQKKLLESNFEIVKSQQPVECTAQIKKFFGKKIGEECVAEFAQKTSAIKAAKKPNQQKLKKDLQKIHLNESHLKEIFSHFKIKTSPKSLGLSNQQYQACVAHAKFIRNRFTCLDLT